MQYKSTKSKNRKQQKTNIRIKIIYKTKKIIYNITSFKGNDEEVVVI